MKHLHSSLLALLILTLVITCLAGCNSKNETVAVECPFSELTWENTVDEMTALEGSDFTTYDSIYNGITYVYPRSYAGLEGSVKYMFDDQDALMCMAWTVSADTNSDLESTYTEIHEQVVDAYGESGYESKNMTNYGDVWHLEEGDIILSVVTTNTQKALQYSYLNPIVSNNDTDD